MKPSLRGGFLPESLADYLELKEKGENQNSRCRRCSRLFASIPEMSAAGWRETQISGFCEPCFDTLFPDE